MRTKFGCILAFFFYTSFGFAQLEILSTRVRVDSISQRTFNNIHNFSNNIVEINQILYIPKIKNFELTITSIQEDGKIIEYNFNVKGSLKKLNRKIKIDDYTHHWFTNNGKLVLLLGTYLVNFGDLLMIKAKGINFTNLKIDLQGCKIVNNKFYGYHELLGNNKKENVRLYEINLKDNSVKYKDHYIQYFFLNQQSPSAYFDFSESFYTIAEPLNYSVKLYNYTHQLIDSFSCNVFENKLKSEDNLKMNAIENLRFRDGRNFNYYSSLLEKYGKIWICKILNEEILWIRFTKPIGGSFTFIDHIWKKNTQGDFILSKEVIHKDYIDNFERIFDLNVAWFGFVYGTKTFSFDNIVFHFVPSNNSVQHEQEKFSDFYGNSIKLESQRSIQLMKFHFQ